MAKNKIIYGGTVLIDMTDATLGKDDGAKILASETAYGKDGEKITGTCTYNADTTDATASASEILAGKTAYLASGEATGTMTNNGAISETISTVSESVTIPAGYHDGSGTVSIDATEQAKIIAGNIKEGVVLLGVTGTYTGEEITAQAKTATPYTTAQTILPDANYDYLSQVTVEAIYYNESANQFGTTVTIGTVAPA